MSFLDLANAGSTTINGANITTGTINCDLLNGGTINGQEFRQVSDYGELIINNGIIRVPIAGAISEILLILYTSFVASRTSLYTLVFSA